MTRDDWRESAEPDEESYLVVAALADGEPVDAAALRVALDDPAVREYLVDLIRLRQSVGTLSGPPVQWRERRSVLSRFGWMAPCGGHRQSPPLDAAGQRTVQVAPAPSVETFVDFSGSASAPKPTRSCRSVLA